ncbi:MAG: hypothetical protein GVY06_08170 [Alphaproteobacteria bacterium]|jgi:F-type H+-transporting ATPase subunit b|nr:hypothetical protein [Alphaproteobacteria bacterium]
MLFILADAAGAYGEAANGDPAGGFPAFETQYWPSQIFWLIVTFAVLYLALSRLVLPRISSILERRGSTVASDLDEAANLNDKAREAEQALSVRLSEARAKAHETASQARAEIESEIAEETRKVDEQIDKQLEQAEAKITAMRADAMANVETIATEAAEAMMAQLGRTVSSQEARKAVKSALN